MGKGIVEHCVKKFSYMESELKRINFLQIKKYFDCIVGDKPSGSVNL